MSTKQNRTQLQILKTSLIRSGGAGGKTSAADVRTMVDALIVSLLNFLDDADMPGGYPSLDNNAFIPESYLSPKVFTDGTGSTLTPNVDSYSCFSLTNPIGASITINNPIGIKRDFLPIVIRLFSSSNTPIVWGNNYRDFSVVMPTTMIAGKTMYTGFLFDKVLDQYNCVSVSIEL